MELKKTRIIRCPACGKMTAYENNPYRPFCSRGCKGLDLIRWSDESYRVAGERNREEDDDTHSHGE